MPASVNEQVIDSVTTDNVKTVAGSGSWAVAQRQLDYVSHAKRVDIIAEKMLGDFVNSPGQGQLDGSQIGAKVANTTPPETGIAQQLANLTASLATVMAMLQTSPAPAAKA
jgi:hypothetical protein